MQRAFLLLCFLTSTLIRFACATVVCEGCRPPELLNAPGVGIDLTMAYGTAAIEYWNGTVVDVIKIDGSLAYIAAMQNLTANAEKVRAGGSSELPFRSWNAPEELIQLGRGDYFHPSLVYRRFVQELRRYVPERRPPPVAETDVHILAIADMFSRLHNALKDIDPPPTAYPLQPSYLRPSITYFMLSYPSIFSYESNSYFRYVSSFADLTMFRATRAEAAALQHYHPHYCDHVDADELICPDTQILVLSYNAASLGGSVFTIDGGIWICLAAYENPALGANGLLRQQNNTLYWDTVRSLLTQLIGNNPIDDLVLLGTHARDPEFLSAVQDVFNERDGGVHLRMKEGSGVADSAMVQDDIFAAARGVALEARDGMETNFESCLENPWCEKPKSRMGKLQMLEDKHKEL